MKLPTFIAAAGAFLLASGASAADHGHAASRPHTAAKHHPVRTARAVRHARVYDASNVPTRSYGHKSSSFVPQRISKSHAKRGAAPHTTVAQRTADKVAPTRARPSAELRAHDDFRQDHPCPSTGWTTGKCPGFAVVGNSSAPSTLQWQATAATPSGDPIK
jgi:hypothetical protein